MGSAAPHRDGEQLHGRHRPLLPGLPSRTRAAAVPALQGGHKRMLEIGHPYLQREARGRHRAARELGETIKQTALCGLARLRQPCAQHHPLLPPRVRSHIKDHFCEAGVCSSLFTAAAATPAGHRQRAGFVSLIGESASTRPHAPPGAQPAGQHCGASCFHPCESKCQRRGPGRPVASAP